MPNSTTNYGLEKPLDNETADIAVINNNMDIIDSKIKEAIDKADEKLSPSLATTANQFLVSSAIGQFVVKTVADIKTLLGLKTAAYKNVGTTVDDVASGVHVHSQADITGLTSAIDGKAPSSHTTVVGATSIGHVKNGGNVTIDINGNMNVSIPTSLPASDVYAWAKAANKPAYTKAEVGLGNVDNTADANKSVNYANSSNYANSAGNADAVDTIHVTGSGGVGLRRITTSTTDPFGGVDGDIWIKYNP